MKYGIKVPFDGVKLWVMQTASAVEQIEVLLFDTEKEAREYSKIWGNSATVLQYEETI